MKKLFLISILSICYSINYSQQTGSFEDPRDGNVYKTVKIGNRTWFAENLAYKTDSGCWAYDNNQTNIAKYGYLYNWETAKQACPSGWHLPSVADFFTLLNTVEGLDSAAYLSLIPSGGSGFSALFGGWRNGNGNSYMVGNNAYFWSSSAYEETTAWFMYISSNFEDAYLHYSNRSYEFSVRCVQDN